MRKTFTTLAAMLATVAFALAALGGAGLADGQTMQFDPTSKTVNYDDGQFEIQVVAGGVSNMGAFGFDLKFDTSILKVVNAAPGPLLGSTGRQPVCLPPVQRTDGITYGCYTNGPSPDGANGGGLLAVLTVQPLAHGSTTLTFADMSMPDVFLYSVPVPATNTAAITVNGGPDPKPAPTPTPQSLAGLPTPPSGSSQPGPGTAAAASGTLGGTLPTPSAGSGGVPPVGSITGAADAGGAGGLGGPGGAGSVAGASAGQLAGQRGVGRFGTGPESNAGAGGSWLATAVFLSIIGAALLAAGVRRGVLR